MMMKDKLLERLTALESKEEQAFVMGREKVSEVSVGDQVRERTTITYPSKEDEHGSFRLSLIHCEPLNNRAVEDSLS